MPDRVVPSPDGALMLGWIFENDMAELEIDNDGKTTWMFPEGKGIQDLLVEMEWE
jgi:hypothetical protein